MFSGTPSFENDFPWPDNTSLRALFLCVDCFCRSEVWTAFNVSKILFMAATAGSGLFLFQQEPKFFPSIIASNLFISSISDWSITFEFHNLLCLDNKTCLCLFFILINNISRRYSISNILLPFLDISSDIFYCQYREFLFLLLELLNLTKTPKPH